MADETITTSNVTTDTPVKSLTDKINDITKEIEAQAPNAVQMWHTTVDDIATQMISANEQLNKTFETSDEKLNNAIDVVAQNKSVIQTINLILKGIHDGSYSGVPLQFAYDNATVVLNGLTELLDLATSEFNATILIIKS